MIDKAQVNHEMLCLGSPWGYAAVLMNGFKLRWARVEKDIEIQERITQSLGRWEPQERKY